MASSSPKKTFSYTYITPYQQFSTFTLGHGTLFVRNDCRQFRFCRPKCHKHFKMKHNPKKLKWTKASRAARGKELVSDATYNLEKRRNTPTRYDRNLMVNTVQAIKRISQLRQVRKLRFQKQRLLQQIKVRKSAAQKEIAKNADLVETVAAKKALRKVAKKSTEKTDRKAQGKREAAVVDRMDID